MCFSYFAGFLATVQYYYQNPRQDILFNFSEIHPDEVIHQLANLKISKSTGIDNIPAKALKIAANIIGPSLTWIFNLSIKTGIYVDEWKKARVVPMYKSGNRQKCENYRPFYLSLVKYLRDLFSIRYINFLFLIVVVCVPNYILIGF